MLVLLLLLQLLGSFTCACPPPFASSPSPATAFLSSLSQGSVIPAFLQPSKLPHNFFHHHSSYRCTHRSLSLSSNIGIPRYPLISTLPTSRIQRTPSPCILSSVSKEASTIVEEFESAAYSEKKRTVAVLVGFLGCRQNILDKYASIYQSVGMPTICILPSTRSMLLAHLGFRGKGSKDVREFHEIITVS